MLTIYFNIISFCSFLRLQSGFLSILSPQFLAPIFLPTLPPSPPKEKCGWEKRNLSFLLILFNLKKDFVIIIHFVNFYCEKNREQFTRSNIAVEDISKEHMFPEHTT